MELILNTFGTGLSVENGNYVVSNIDGRRMVPLTHVTSIQIAMHVSDECASDNQL